MGIVLRFPKRRHARASVSRKSSTDTRFLVADLTAAAKSFDSQLLPLRKRDTVERSHFTPIARINEAIASSSKPSNSMNFDRCMAGIVHTMHGAVNAVCALSDIEGAESIVHNTHMGRTAGKKKEHEALTAPRNRTFMREYRIAAGLTQEAAAAKLGYGNRSTLSRVEAGEVPYNQDLLEAAAAVYKTSIWHLLYCPPNTPLPKALEIWTKSLG